jgi:hypothetical protein
MERVSSGSPETRSRRSLIMIKKNGELQQAEEYNAIDVLHPNLSILTPPNQEKAMEFNIDNNNEVEDSPMINDEFFGEMDTNIVSLKIIND